MAGVHGPRFLTFPRSAAATVVAGPQLDEGGIAPVPAPPFIPAIAAMPAAPVPEAAIMPVPAPVPAVPVGAPAAGGDMDIAPALPALEPLVPGMPEVPVEDIPAVPGVAPPAPDAVMPVPAPGAPDTPEGLSIVGSLLQPQLRHIIVRTDQHEFRIVGSCRAQNTDYGRVASCIDWMPGGDPYEILFQAA